MQSVQSDTRLDFKDFVSEAWDDPEYRFTSKMEDISVFLTGLLYSKKMTRSDLARTLNWKTSRVSKALSGKENLTLRTLFEIINAAGYDFDLVARDPDEVRATQPWENEKMMVNLINLHFDFQMKVSLGDYYFNKAEGHCNTAEALLEKSKAILHTTTELSHMTWKNTSACSMPVSEHLSKVA